MDIKGFHDAFELVIGHEGKYSNHPDDRGKETMYGITARVARRNGYYDDMRYMPLVKAQWIAKQEYWDSVRGDELHPELAYQLFDIRFNGGQPVHWLQKALGITEDGKFGPVTLKAAKEADLRVLCLRLGAYRLKYLASLAVWPSFSRGWVNRVADVLLEGAD